METGYSRYRSRTAIGCAIVFTVALVVCVWFARAYLTHSIIVALPLGTLNEGHNHYHLRGVGGSSVRLVLYPKQPDLPQKVADAEFEWALWRGHDMDESGVFRIADLDQNFWLGTHKSECYLLSESTWVSEPKREDFSRYDVLRITSPVYTEGMMLYVTYFSPYWKVLLTTVVTGAALGNH